MILIDYQTCSTVNVYTTIKNTSISFYKKPVYKKLETGAPKTVSTAFCGLQKSKKLVLLFWFVKLFVCNCLFSAYFPI